MLLEAPAHNIEVVTNRILDNWDKASTGYELTYEIELLQ